MDIIQGLVQAGSTAGRPALRIVSNNRTFDIINTITSNVIFSILNDGSVGAGSTIYTNLITNYADSGNSSTVVSSLPDTLFTTNPTGVSSGTIGTTDRYYIFTHTGGYNTNTAYNNVPIPAGITFDVFMIGGGGAGGGIGGAGGGSGACLVALNQTIAAGNYGFVVGGAGSGGITGSGNSGYDTFIGNNIYKARGGGGGAADARNGIVGGSSGGAAGGVDSTAYISVAPATDNYYQSLASGPVVNTTSLYSIYGNKGGNASATNTYDLINYGGGGGIGAAATDATTTLKATTGGDGLYQVSLNNTSYNLRTYFTNNGTFGVQDGATGNYFIGGGGGAGGYNPFITPTNIAGGKGGGGIGKNGNSPANGTDGFPNTGSGGGAGTTGAGGNSFGGNGGSGLLIFRYRNTSVTSTGVSSQWTTAGVKIYYNLGNIGIGATDPIAPLHIYNATNARLLLDATTTGTATLEFRRGTGGDAQNDFRFINDSNSSLKLQCENSTQVFGNAIADLVWFSSNETIIHKNTTMNGRVGVGTVYHATLTNRSLDVLGDANISGVVSTSGLSILSSNVVITNSLSSNTILTIANGLIPPTITSSPVATTTGTMGNYIYQVFTYTTETAGAGTRQTLYTLNVASGGVVCDVLMVGGGGAGGIDIGGGGGGGAVLYGTNISIASGTYEIRVGDGAVAGEVRGKSTEGFGATILGGGCAGNATWEVNTTANSGGSGAGGKSKNVNMNTANITAGTVGSSTKGTILNTATLYNGNVGGTGLQEVNSVNSAGGGGAGAVGGNGNTGTGVINSINVGGAGVLVNITGENYYWGGGGAGGCYKSNPSNGGIGGGGAGYNNTVYGGSITYGANGGNSWGTTPTGTSITNGTPSSGGGGGGSPYNIFTAGKGGSGIIIIRYLTPPTTISSTATINLVLGTVADANHDFRVGNYNGEFKIISSVSSQDTDYIRITTAGAITNPTGTASWNTGSDRRIKENIERASYDKCYENINKLELNRFNYVSGFNTVNRDKTQLGFIAQEVNDIFPKAISSQEYYTNELCIPDLLSIDITQINYSLYGAVKKLIKINKDQETKFDTFDRRLKTIETALNIVTEPITSNIIVDPITSNIIVDPITSNIIVDPIEPITSNIIVEPIEPITSNIIVDPIEPITSNIIVDPIEASTSNLATE